MASEVVDPEQPKLLSFGRALNKEVSVFFCHLVEKRCCFLNFFFKRKRGFFKMCTFEVGPCLKNGGFALLLLTY